MNDKILMRRKDKIGEGCAIRVREIRNGVDESTDKKV